MLFVSILIWVAVTWWACHRTKNLYPILITVIANGLGIGLTWYSLDKLFRESSYRGPTDAELIGATNAGAPLVWIGFILLLVVIIFPKLLGRKG